MERRKAVVPLVLAAVGAVLLIYGLFAHVDSVWPMDRSATVASLTTESAMILEVTVGGLKRDDLGQIRKTYEGQAPKACPT